MIILPNLDAITFIHDGSCCSITGHPYQIANDLLIQEMKIDENLSVIKPVFDELQIFDTGDIAVFLLQEFLDTYQIKYTMIKRVKPDKIFKEAKWKD